MAAMHAQLIAKVEDAELAQAENIKNAVDAYLTENPVEPGATKEQAKQIEANRKAIEEYVPPVTSVNGMTGDVVIAAGGGAASSVEWSNVVNKPETYPPEAHGHTWNDVTEKPEAYPPSEHTHSYADLEDKPTIPTVPRFLPNPYSLTINGESYDGSKAVEVTIDAGNDVEIDETLTQGGKAADAKKTGDALNQLSQQMNDKLNSRLGTFHVYNFSRTSADDTPKSVLQANFSEMEAGPCIITIVGAAFGPNSTVLGEKTDDLHGAFILYGYAHEGIMYYIVRNGIWSEKSIV